MSMNFFNWTFFSKKMSGFYLLVILFFYPIFVLAAVEKIVFITEPQTVLSGQLSGAITIQSQTNDGVKEDVIETMDLVFTSDSSAGEFLGSTGNPATKYMSKNSANRTFYYRDSVLGEHNISVTATGRDSGRSFSIDQKIVISDIPTTTSTDNNSSTSTVETTSSGGGSYSSHSSQTDLSGYEETTPSIGAGRKRLTIVGSPVDFRVEKSKGTGDVVRYVWAFGDGTSAEGENVSHSYKFPGEYNVVLNGYWGNTQLVSRTKILVEEAKVAITEVDQQLNFIEITNTGSKEINIGNWIIRGATDFSLPPDTIIDSGKGIKFSLDHNFFNATTSQLALISPDGKEIERREILLATELENKLAKLKKELITLQSERRGLDVSGVAVEKNEYDNQPSDTKIITLAPKLSWWQKMFRMSK